MRQPNSPAVDPPRATYHATRAHLAALTAAVQPGDRIYINHEGQEREFIVTGDTGALCSAPLVTPASQSSEPVPRIPIHQLLARCGAIYTQPPTQP